MHRLKTSRVLISACQVTIGLRLLSIRLKVLRGIPRKPLLQIMNLSQALQELFIG